MLNESAHSLTRCKKIIHVLQKAGMITRQNAWFANQEREAVASTKMTNYFVTAGSTAAEGTLVFHAVKHHHCFLSMDCTPVLRKKIFSDSNAAKKFSSGRTKTEKVVTSVLAQYFIDAVSEKF